MTSNQILKDALRTTLELDGESHFARVKVLETAIMEAMKAHRSEVLDAFNEGENQGFASGSNEGFEQGVAL